MIKKLNRNVTTNLERESMSYEKSVTKLEALYSMAVEQKDVHAAVMVVRELITVESMESSKDDAN